MKAHQVYCEDSPTKGLYYDHCQSDDLDLHSSSQVRLKRLLFKLQYLRQYLSYYIQTWHDHDDDKLMDATYAHARFNDLDHDARSEWVGKGNGIGIEWSWQLSKQ